MPQEFTNRILSPIHSRLMQWPWYESAYNLFWCNPDRTHASKTTFAIACLSIPLILAGYPFFAVTLALGAVAGALSETDDHPKGRFFAMMIKVLAFGISSTSVTLLHPYPILLGAGLGASTVIYALIGGLNDRYRGITSGTILVGTYAMLGASSSPAWYWQPILLPLGALCFGLFSLGLLYLRPFRPLEEQLGRGYYALAKYMDLKSSLFPCDESAQAELRNKLALENVKVVVALDQCRDVFNNYRASLPNDEPLIPYLRSFMLLQSLHERAASSHQRYDLLSKDPHNQVILEGIGQCLRQLSDALGLYARCLLIKTPYQHPTPIQWLVNILKEKLLTHDHPYHPDLTVLVDNLDSIQQSLSLQGQDLLQGAIPKLNQDTRSLTRRFLDQCNWNHPRLRYAFRLGLCLVLGFSIAHAFHLHKGEWVVLTSLMVLQQSFSETRRRFTQRVLGTFYGVVGGVTCVQLLPTTAGQIVFMLTSVFAYFYWLKRNYAISVIFITTYVLCVFNIVSHQGEALMLSRLLDTLIGSILAYLTVRLLWPDWQHKRLPTLLHSAIRENASYLRAVLNEYHHGPSDDDYAYRVARRSAHRADNALATAWRDIQLEPKKNRHAIHEVFTLTYQNHALLSYISALGANRHNPNHPSQTPPHACEVLNLLDAASECLTCNTPVIFENMDSLLTNLKNLSLTEPDNTLRHQITLLYHISEVAKQILNVAHKVKI